MSDSMYLDKYSVADKVAVVTGAATGIGFASAQALAEAGAMVVAGLDAEAGDAAAKQLVELGYSADLRRWMSPFPRR